MPEATILMQVTDPDTGELFIEGSAELIGYNPEPGLDHVGWIPIASCSFKFNRTAPVAEGTTEDKPAAEPETTVDPIKITRTSDFISAEILMWLSDRSEDDGGPPRKNVLIDFCHPSGRFYQRYQLDMARLVAGDISYKHPDDATETLTFTYDRVTIYQRPVDEGGEVDVGKQTSTMYEVQSNLEDRRERAG